MPKNQLHENHIKQIIRTIGKAINGRFLLAIKGVLPKYVQMTLSAVILSNANISMIQKRFYQWLSW